MNANINTAIVTDVSTKQAPLTSMRKTALLAGVLYLLTFVSIPTLALYGSIHEPNYIVGPGPDNAVIIGGILEIIVALAGIGTAVVLFPVLKKQHEGVALGLVASRVLEAGTMFAGVAFLLSVVTLRQAGSGAGTSAPDVPAVGRRRCSALRRSRKRARPRAACEEESRTSRGGKGRGRQPAHRLALGRVCFLPNPGSVPAQREGGR